MMVVNTERQSHRPWRDSSPPSRILLIRFHAIGDVALTLPFGAGLRAVYPDSRIDVLTSTESVGLFDALTLVNTVTLVRRQRSRLARLAEAVRVGAALREVGYDLVIDLQRNWRSRLIRRAIAPAAWSEFDRFSPRSAADRIRSAIQDAGLERITATHTLPVRRPLVDKARRLLEAEGWNGASPLIVLNPAGLWHTRNWPLRYYLEFADLWSARKDVQFPLIGTGRLAAPAALLKDHLGSRAIDLSGRTSLAEALALLQLTSALLTEDSGLMHMAWACGVPTVALFGSSNHVWSSPTGEQSVTLHSGDLPCGACMEPTCRHGDVHCLTRYTPEMVIDRMSSLLRRKPPGV